MVGKYSREISLTVLPMWPISISCCPETCREQAAFKLSLLKEPHRAAFPYEVRTLEVIEETARDFEIIFSS